MKRLLIVDDIPQNLYLLEVLLKTHGYEVDQASNGIEALEAARLRPPDTIISDILMPGMDGFSLCRAWMNDERLREIPFVFYTATYTDARDESLAKSLGAVAFIIKPLEPGEFLKIIESILEKYPAGKKVAHPQPVVSENGYLKQYNETLVRKLEDKMMQLERSNRRLASLYQASCELHANRHPKELVEIILKAVVETAGYQQAIYFTYDENQGYLFLLAATGFSKDLTAKYKERLVFVPGEARGVVGQVAESRETVNIGDISVEPKWIRLDSSIQSALFTPVCFEQTLLGVIALYSSIKNAFAEEDEHDIAVLANSLATAIVNENNLEKLNKQFERLSSLHEIETAISSSLDLSTILDILLVSVLEQLKVDAADVLLIENSSTAFEFKAGRGFRSQRIEKLITRGMDPNRMQVIAGTHALRLRDFSDPTLPPEAREMWAAEGFVTCFAAPLIAKGNREGMLEVYHRTPFAPDLEWFDFFETLAGQAAIAIDNARLFERLQRSNNELSLAYDATIKGWSRAMDLRDQETEGHTQRVVEWTVKLAERMGLDSEQIVHIRRGALLHDIGKLGVPDSILLKPDILTEAERDVMRKHPDFANEMLQPINYLHPALEIPYCHHEKWDGTGYPRGLIGEQIPLAARLFSIVDVWDALRSDRPYRKAWTDDKVIEYLESEIGRQFDPKVATVFLEMVNNTAR